MVYKLMLGPNNFFDDEITIFDYSLDPAGVAIGAGWQSLVALINTGCYYLFGLPIGALLGYKFKLNAAVSTQLTIQSSNQQIKY